MPRDLQVYQLILNPRAKMPVKEADPRRFARKVQEELGNIMSLLASDEDMITIDGQTFDKTTATGQLVINDKLSELEAQNTQNFTLLNVIKRTEDSLRQMLG